MNGQLNIEELERDYRQRIETLKATEPNIGSVIDPGLAEVTGDAIEYPSGFATIEGISSVYEGQIKQGKKHGLGLEVNEHQRITYIGEWKAGGFVYGICRSESGDAYAGSWGSGRNGFGRQEWASGDIYEGNWLHNARCGEGTLYSADGSIIQGIWSADLPYEAKWTNAAGDSRMIHNFSIGDNELNFIPIDTEWFFVPFTDGEFIDGIINGFLMEDKDIGQIKMPSLGVYEIPSPPISCARELDRLLKDLSFPGASTPKVFTPRRSNWSFYTSTVVELVRKQHPSRTDVLKALEKIVEAWEGPTFSEKQQDYMLFEYWPIKIDTEWKNFERLVVHDTPDGTQYIDILPNGEIFRIIHIPDGK